MWDYPVPVQLRVLGQAYGSFTMMKHILMCMAGQDIARWALADGSGHATVSLEHPFCLPDADPNFPRKQGAFGKKKMRMGVDLGSPAEAATRRGAPRHAQQGRRGESEGGRGPARLDARWMRGPREILREILPYVPYSALPQ